jgi:hypothetical protein
MLWLINVLISFIPCVAGNPRPVVKWYRNDQLASNISTVVKTSVGGHLVRNEIIVRNLGRQDLHSQLKCRASNNNRTHPLEATVHVDMNCKYPGSPCLVITISKQRNQKMLALKTFLFVFFSFLQENWML